jgi:hypothetical protein
MGMSFGDLFAHNDVRRRFDPINPTALA